MAGKKIFANAANTVALPEDYNQDNLADGNSVSTFIDNLFKNGTGDVRNPEAMTQGILAAAKVNKEGYWLIDSAARERILGAWMQIWRKTVLNANTQIDARTQQTDVALFTAMANYMQHCRLFMFEPVIKYVGPSAGGTAPVYRLKGYTQSPLFLTDVEIGAPKSDDAQGKFGNINAFLKKFATGAHFVVISSPLDYQPRQGEEQVEPFWCLFQRASYCRRRDAGVLNEYSATAYMHSHYSGVKGLTNAGTGYAYPNTVGGIGGPIGLLTDAFYADSAPNPCPFVCSLLVDTTAHSEPNSFFQLEGWPGIATRGFGAKGRHGQDFAVHQATKWNIATYGASPYSEKRGTTIFLAPGDWKPSQGVILWPKFQGSTTLQSWYDSSLIEPSASLFM